MQKSLKLNVFKYIPKFVRQIKKDFYYTSGAQILVRDSILCHRNIFMGRQIQRNLFKRKYKKILKNKLRWRLKYLLSIKEPRKKFMQNVGTRMK